MTIYKVKVRANFPDGWGRDGGMKIHTVGQARFWTREEAEQFMEKAKKMDERMFWCGEPWIEETYMPPVPSGLSSPQVRIAPIFCSGMAIQNWLAMLNEQSGGK